MTEKEPNYVKEILSSQWNLAFIGVMFLLMVTLNFVGFGALLLAGEVGAFLLAQMPQVQHYIRLRSQIEGQANLKEKAAETVKNLPPSYQDDFQNVAYLCDEIEQKSQIANSGNYSIKSLTEKLGTFRYEYARMLQAHHLTATRDVVRLTKQLQDELRYNEAAVAKETSPKVRAVLEQNVRIIKQRLQRTAQLEDLIRLLGVRLSVVKNSLSLLQDEIFTATNPESMSASVDNLLMTLNIDDELKATYEDLLDAESKVQTPLPAAAQQPNKNAQRQTNLRRIK